MKSHKKFNKFSALVPPMRDINNKLSIIIVTMTIMMIMIIIRR